MKKRVCSIMLSTLLAFSMVGCKGTGASSSPSPSPTPTAPQASTPADTSTPSPSPAAGSNKDKITYANWNLGTQEENNIERRMIKLFNENNKDVEVVVATNVEYGAQYPNSLSTLAASGQLPDVIALDNIPQPYSNKWLADITDIAEADSEFKNVIKVLTDAARVKDRVVAVPFGMHLFGMLINVDLFHDANIDEPTYGISLEDFEKAVKAVNQPANGVVAIKFEGDMINWLPTAMNKDLGWFTFDGEKYNLDKPEFLAAIKKVKDIRSNGLSFGGLSDSQRANFRGTADWEAWPFGETAINFDGSWALGSIGRDINFNVSFAGLPGGKSIIIPDFCGITATSKNKEQAYNFIKWMSFGKDGFLSRIDVAKDMGVAYFSMPMTNDKETLDKFHEYLSVPGLDEAFADIENALLEPNKFIPGYRESRWEAQTGLAVPNADGTTTENANIGQLLDAAMFRGLNFADYAKQVNDLANKSYQEVYELMK